MAANPRIGKFSQLQPVFGAARVVGDGSIPISAGAATGAAIHAIEW
jgi:hypothetical protein